MMEKQALFFVCVSCVLVFSMGIESPQFTVVHSESDFEIRLYRESSWMSAPVREISFDKATREGFHRLYQYIHGANFNSSRLTMVTAPVLTSIIPATNGSEYIVKLYISAKYQGVPPQPQPELNLHLDKWRGHCVAVRKFSGFARDESVIKEVEALVSSLSRFLLAGTALQDMNAYSIAQYSAPFRRSGRLNEVWMNVSNYKEWGCPSY